MTYKLTLTIEKPHGEMEFNEYSKIIGDAKYLRNFPNPRLDFDKGAYNGIEFILETENPFKVLNNFTKNKYRITKVRFKPLKK